MECRMTIEKSRERVVVILPAYNEELTIEGTIRDYHDHCPEATIVVIDNNSSDNTQKLASEVLSSLHCGYLLFEGRQGKSYAVRRGFVMVDADIYVLTDADTTYPAKDIQKHLQLIKNHAADMVVGNRFYNQRYTKENKRLFHNFGNNLVKFLVNLLFSSDLHDIMSGYRIFSRNFVKNFPILSQGFELETEMTLHALDKRFLVAEVPIEYKDRPVGSFSKLNTFRDGFRVLRTIFDVFKDYKPLAFFSFCGLLVLVIAAALATITLFARQDGNYSRFFMLTILTVGSLTTSLIFFAIGLILDIVRKYHRFDFEHKILKQSNERVS